MESEIRQTLDCGVPVRQVTSNISNAISCVACFVDGTDLASGLETLHEFPAASDDRAPDGQASLARLSLKLIERIDAVLLPLCCEAIS